MKRRHVLASMGALTASGSALVGAGAFTRVESQREVRIEVEGDEDAYLGLKYGSLDNVECGDTVTFGTITNQLKQPVKIDHVGFSDVYDIELSEPMFVRCPDGEKFDEDDEFLDVGECVEIRVTIEDCPVEEETVDVPFRVEVDGEDVLLVAQESAERSVAITCECPRDPDLSFVAFCGDVEDTDIENLEILYEDGEDIGVSWEFTAGFDDSKLKSIVLYGGGLGPPGEQAFLNYEYDGETTEVLIDREDDDWGADERVIWSPPGSTESGQEPSCPCRDNREDAEYKDWLDTSGGVKFEESDGTLDPNDGDNAIC